MTDLDTNKIIKQLAEKIRFNFDKSIQIEKNNIENDCENLHKELIKSFENFNSSQPTGKKTFFGEDFKTISYFRNSIEFMSTCHFDTSNYEKELTKLSGLKTTIVLNGSNNKFYWSMRVSKN